MSSREEDQHPSAPRSTALNPGSHKAIAGKLTTRRSPRLLLRSLFALPLVLLALPSAAQAATCPNEEFRTGPSASLPDCRAYELVTPEELGRSQAITFTNSDHAIPSADGEHLAL